jgi:gamma-glutamylcyclotransferase (GGCT)/AIG2-like uncharacterized protein YtfP
MTFVFVYGTLKQGGCRRHFLNGSHFCGRALTQPGYRLFDLGDYPGLVDGSPGGCIEGELYRVSDAGLAVLDAVEGVAENWFARREIRLQSPHDDFSAEAYFYCGSLKDRKELIRSWRNEKSSGL